jgi:hypothetical protein
VQLIPLDIGGPDHLVPFLGFVGDEPAEVGGRAGERHAAEVGQPRLDLRIGERGVDLGVERLDDRGGRALRRADAPPVAPLVARHEFGDRRHVRQRVRACHGGDGEHAQLVGLDVFDGRGHRVELARLPPAPGRFSTTNDWPSRSESHCAIRRALMSAAPSAAKPTTMRTGRVGQVCARAVRARAASAGTPAAT